MKNKHMSATSQNPFEKTPSMLFIGAAVLIIVFGIILRFWHITTDNVLFYDEGMYVMDAKPLVDVVAANPPKNLHELAIVTGLLGKAALNTNKALWFFLMNVRVFCVGAEGWIWPRIISAIFGVLTLGLLFVFVKRLYQSNTIALCSMLVLSILPSHVFYSHLGMQESLSTFLFLLGIFLFCLRREFGVMTVLSAIVITAVFFTNYRMILATPFIILLEIILAAIDRRAIQWAKIAWHTGIFYALILSIGMINGGNTLFVTFGWMFRQVHMAADIKPQLLSILSYPYYVFKLETVAVGFFCLCALGWVFTKNWLKALPILFVALQMFLFSLGADKGVRYGAFVLPFLALSCVLGIEFLATRCLKAISKHVVMWGALCVIIPMAMVSMSLATAQTDYQKAMAFVDDKDAQAAVVATQPLLCQMFTQHYQRVLPLPDDIQGLAQLYQKGARYLIVDPQAYISWTANGARFTRPLKPFLQIIEERIQPVMAFDHINHNPYLERFVLDHNEHLSVSLDFLKTNVNDGKILIYDLKEVFR